MASRWTELGLEAARHVAPRVEEIEAGRRVPLDLAHELRDLGAFRVWLPKDLGGDAGDIRAAVEVVEALARTDASAAWVVMIGLTTAILAGHLEPAAAAEVYGTDAITGGVIAPNGTATRVDGGYKVSGRWSFASGCQHCSWLVGGALIDDDVKLLLFPAGDVEIIDNWDVVGLRGTGSHDISVRDVFVPDGRAVSLLAPRAHRDEQLYRLPIPSALAPPLAAVVLGCARGALDELVALATTKTPSMSMNTLAKRSYVQIEVARAEIELRAATGLLLDAVDKLWESPTERQRAVTRGAAINAVTTGASVVDRAYTLAGGTSLRSGSPLQRRLRDVHAATQHAIVNPATLELIGRVLLDLPTDTSMI